MIEALALTVVVLTGLYFIALAVVSLFCPAQANRFLLGFAGSALAHYTELFLRFMVGAALVLHAPRMLLPGAFTVFGWVLLVTTACLLLVPWRWHHRFAQQAVPRATRHITLVGLASLAIGGFTLAAVIRGSAA
ncbi:hypothetical protein [Lysobacter sp. D1-1-M9]|uniref:hypothetical protein n=1 Tax=Novilysobacter longmucuonensis TaxID=3098603 RepID=UPI002FC65387